MIDFVTADDESGGRPDDAMPHPIPLQPEMALLGPAVTRSISPENPTGAPGRGRRGHRGHRRGRRP